MKTAWGWSGRIAFLGLKCKDNSDYIEKEAGRRVLDRYAGAGLGAEARGLPHGGILVPGALEFSVVKKKKKNNPMLWFHETTLWQMLKWSG